MTLLHIDSSARTESSISRQLTNKIVAQFGGPVIRRDLNNALPQIDEAWVNANFTPADDRDAEQRDRLALSDHLVEELKQADTIVLGAPIYNFGIPASLKAWFDLVARAGVTFRYTENGPVGLLENKRAIVVISSGGTPVGSELDFASGHIKQVLSFIGISEVEFVVAERTAVDLDAARIKAEAQVAALAA